MTISLDVSNKLPDGLVEVYGRIQRVASALNITLLIVGATARDIILVHGYNAAIERGQITWPPEHAFQMSVLGFDEVYKHAWDVLLTREPALSVKVASPAGILLLKLIAWTERGREYQGKDAIDIYFVIKHYSKIPDVFEALYERDYMELQDYDDMKASAMKEYWNVSRQISLNSPVQASRKLRR